MAKNSPNTEPENSATFPFVFNRQPDVGIMERQVIHATSHAEALKKVKREKLDPEVAKQIEQDQEKAEAAPADQDSTPAVSKSEERRRAAMKAEPDQSEPAADDQVTGSEGGTK